MANIWNSLKGKKTYAVCALTIVVVALQQMGVVIPGVPTINPNDALNALLAATIRHGIG